MYSLRFGRAAVLFAGVQEHLLREMLAQPVKCTALGSDVM